MSLIVVGATDTGKVRDQNEDSILALEMDQSGIGVDALLVVADGMGGHAAGEGGPSGEACGVIPENQTLPAGHTPSGLLIRGSRDDLKGGEGELIAQHRVDFTWQCEDTQ